MQKHGPHQTQMPIFPENNLGAKQQANRPSASGRLPTTPWIANTYAALGPCTDYSAPQRARRRGLCILRAGREARTPPRGEGSDRGFDLLDSTGLHASLVSTVLWLFAFHVGIRGRVEGVERLDLAIGKAYTTYFFSILGESRSSYQCGCHFWA